MDGNEEIVFFTGVGVGVSSIVDTKSFNISTSSTSNKQSKMSSPPVKLTWLTEVMTGEPPTTKDGRLEVVDDMTTAEVMIR